MRCALTAICIIGVLASANTLAANTIPAVDGKCPQYYSKHKQYCTPRSRSAKEAIPLQGTSCPLYWDKKGGHCVKRSEKFGSHTIERTGSSCPRGYSKDKAYCVKREQG